MCKPKPDQIWTTVSTQSVVSLGASWSAEERWEPCYTISIYLIYLFIHFILRTLQSLKKKSFSQKLQNTFSSPVDPLALWNHSLMYHLIIILRTWTLPFIHSLVCVGYESHEMNTDRVAFTRQASSLVTQQEHEGHPLNWFVLQSILSHVFQQSCFQRALSNWKLNLSIWMPARRLTQVPPFLSPTSTCIWY